ncbi:hypothetical protein KBX50_05065 [Micromonospora sp. C51]|uniref:hypothetical protein n=1 Tax=Micromonospora sp. C51 TaxID=2824879 RepID=UPI001B37DEB8|nr:hypothetical protein [Micromonospora sp. C51]MBQ1047828.1 hypothetical protein [Micromonospora sp. C51]
MTAALIEPVYRPRRGPALHATGNPLWPELYIAPLAAGREWPRASGLGRVRAHVRARTAEGRWRIPPHQRYGRLVDSVGFAETADGPLLLTCRLPLGMARAVPPGAELVMVLPVPKPGEPYTISACMAEVHP